MSSLFKRKREDSSSVLDRINSFINDLDVKYGKFKGLVASFNENDTKTQVRELNNLYEELHGESMTYDDIQNYVRTHPGLIHAIQGLFDLELQRMGRSEEDFVIEEPRAIAFIYSLMTESVPDFTFVNWTEPQVREYIRTGVHPHDSDIPIKPFKPIAYPGKGGKRTKKNKRSARKSRKNRKSAKGKR